MSTLLKDHLNKDFFIYFIDMINPLVLKFDKGLFLDRIFTEEYAKLELKERLIYSAKVLHEFMPADFEKASSLLISIAKIIQETKTKSLLGFMFLPEYISLYGLNHLESSIRAMEIVTQLTSCEFAVRPFIQKYENQMISQLIVWSTHPNDKVRRLSSEGSRPRLPWGIALTGFKKDPNKILPILENLKQDPCENVRLSVANNINDISKDNPNFVIDIAKKWQGISKETDAIIKHGLRTLLKKSHPLVLNYYKLNSDWLCIDTVNITTPRVKIGDFLEFSFSISNNSIENQRIRIEYCIFFKKKNGDLSSKVFKISERDCKANQTIRLTKRHTFKIITTRVFYSGYHHLQVIVNGKKSNIQDFYVETC